MKTERYQKELIREINTGSLVTKKDWVVNTNIDPELSWLIFNEKGRWNSIFHWALEIKN